MPPRADTQRNRERILHSAAQVFAEAGPSASVNAIVARAGLTKKTLYRHFASKDDLLNEIMADHYDRLTAICNELEQAPITPIEAVTAFMERAALQITPDRAYFHIALMTGAESESIRRSATQLHDAQARLLAAAQADGSLRSDLVPGDLQSILIAVTSSITPAAAAIPMAWRRYLALAMDALRPSAEVVDEPPMLLADFGVYQRELVRRRRAREAARKPAG